MKYTDNKVKVTVVESHCPKYKTGDVIHFVGSVPVHRLRRNSCI